jgi:hypothetical protein
MESMQGLLSFEWHGSGSGMRSRVVTRGYGRVSGGCVWR